MADGGVIIDDAGAQETRIWRHRDKMHLRAPMLGLTDAKPFRIDSAQLRAYAIKADNNWQTGLSPKSVKVTANDGSTLTIANGKTYVEISPSVALKDGESIDEAFVYRLGSAIATILVDGDKKDVSSQHTTMILSVS